MSKEILTFFQQHIDQPLPEHSPAFTKWLGGTVKKAESGTFEMEFLVREDMSNPLGLLHGGVQAAILDEIMGMNVASLDKELPAISLNLNVDFLGKAYTNDIVMAKSQVVREGRQIIHVMGEITHKDGKLIAKATSNLLNVSLTKDKK